MLVNTKIMKTVNQNCWCTGWDPNPLPPKWISGNLFLGHSIVCILVPPTWPNM